MNIENAKIAVIGLGYVGLPLAVEFGKKRITLGFDIDELNKIIKGADFEPATEDEQGKLDELDPKWCQCPHCGKEFDLRTV